MIAQNLIHDYQMKWMRIQKVMQEKGADGCLLTNGINLFYTTDIFIADIFIFPPKVNRGTSSNVRMVGRRTRRLLTQTGATAGFIPREWSFNATTFVIGSRRIDLL